MAGKETTAVAVREASIKDLQTVSQLFAQSGYFPDAKSAAQAFVKIQAGREMGIPAMAAMTGIAIIQGKPVAGANIIAAKVKMAGYDYRVRRLDNRGCKIEFFDRPGGESIGVSEFTEEDAKAAGLCGKDNWRKYARNMYFARAISNGQRWFCPDATQGQLVYTPDELGGQVDGDGNPVIDVRGEPVRDKQTLDDIIPRTSPAQDADYEEVNTDTGEVMDEPPAWVTDDPPSEPADSGADVAVAPDDLPEQLTLAEIVWGCLQSICGDDKAAAAKLYELTTWTNKKTGETVKGKRKIEYVSAAQLEKVVYPEIKKLWEEKFKQPFPEQWKVHKQTNQNDLPF